MLGMIIIGLIAGILAKLIMSGRDPGGFIVTILLGIAGSWLAGVLGRSMGWYEPGEGAGLIGSTVGALLILFIYNRLVARRTTTTI